MAGEPLAFRVVFFSHQLSGPPVVVQWFAVLVQPRALQLPGGGGESALWCRLQKA